MSGNTSDADAEDMEIAGGGGGVALRDRLLGRTAQSQRSAGVAVNMKPSGR